MIPCARLARAVARIRCIGEPGAPFAAASIRANVVDRFDRVRRFRSTVPFAFSFALSVSLSHTLSLRLAFVLSFSIPLAAGLTLTGIRVTFLPDRTLHARAQVFLLALTSASARRRATPRKNECCDGCKTQRDFDLVHHLTTSYGGPCRFVYVGRVPGPADDVRVVTPAYMANG